MKADRKWTSWRRLGVVALLTVLVFGPAAQSSALQAPDDIEAIVDALFGDDLVLEGAPAPSSDAAGDGADRAGNASPMPQGTDISSADWFYVHAAMELDTVEDVCNNGLQTPTGQAEAVCPDTFADLAVASRFLMITAEFTGPITAENLTQFVYLWAEPGIPTYVGAAGDYNNDETDSVDVFRFSLTEPFQLGRTSYRDGAFSFEAFTAAMALIGSGYLVLLVPTDSFAGECLNVAVAAVAGNSIDKAALPESPSGTYSATEPTATTAGSTTTTSSPTTSLSTRPESGEAPTVLDEEAVGETSTEAEAPAGGINPLWPIAILVFALGGTGLLLYLRRSKDCRQELAELDAARERLVGAERRLAEARRRLAADTGSTALGVEVAEAEATVERGRQSVADWEYAYNLCLGLVEPRGAGVSGVPETPSARPMTVVEDVPSQPPGVSDTDETTLGAPPPPPGTGAVGGSVGAAVGSDPCGGKTVEWRSDESVADIWDEPVGTISVTMDRAPGGFLRWVESHGELSDSGRVHAVVPLEEAADLLDVETARDLLRTDDPRYRVELEVVVEIETVGRHCEREWTCVDGVWSRTGKVRLSEKRFIGESAPYRFAETCRSGGQVATKLNNAMRRVQRMQARAGEAEQRLRARCSDG